MKVPASLPKPWMMACFGLALAGGLGSGPSTAQSFFDQSCNANGWVLTPKPGVEDRTYYLGKSCDAYHPTKGAGQWCWANGGVITEFSGETTGFARMEVHCQHPALDSVKCSCNANPIPSWSN